MSALVPLHMLSSVAALNSELPGWTLLDVPASEPRAFEHTVSFERSFASVPLIHVAICGFDVGHRDAARLRVRAVAAHEGGFTIRVETWLNTQVWAVDVSWLAVGTAP